MKEIELSQVKCVYLGMNRCCRCGCKGNYTYTSYSEKDKYHDVDDRRVKAALTRARNLVDSGEGKIDEENNRYINICHGDNRAITIYFL